jgi:hypothetical protein
MALDSIAFRPRVLRDVSNVDASVRQFDRKLRLPVVLAPVGSLESFHAAGAESVVRAVDEFGAGHMLSSVCEPGLEDLAKAAPNALRLYQLYVRGDAAWVDDHVERAIAAGYSAFFLTVDTAHYSRRERDIAKRFVTAGRRRVQNRIAQAASTGARWSASRCSRSLSAQGRGDGRGRQGRRQRRVTVTLNHGGRQRPRRGRSMCCQVVDTVASRAKVWSTARSAAAAYRQGSRQAPTWSVWAACSAMRWHAAAAQAW